MVEIGGRIMRQIEFRGKRLDNGEWVYGNLQVHLVDGYLDHSKKRYFIEYDYMDNIYGQVFRDRFEVDPSTVGQFTGLFDKNGKKIYEGDFIQSNQSKYKRFNKNGIYEIYFNEFLCHFALVDSSVSWNNKNGAYDNYSLTGAKTKDFEVIGNIFNKECE